MLVLVIAQAVQVLLLALAVFAFFIVFGVVAIEDEVIEAGSVTGHPDLTRCGIDLVSLRAGEGRGVPGVLLAASTSPCTRSPTSIYRQEFFTVIMSELPPRGRSAAADLPRAACAAEADSGTPQRS